ncbi:hypothetical protein M6D93_10710 [Jatrophihabitans telluris]|uniref:Phosphotyrosine protein phosphatase I domain-containing protein n=1 Tax=Jatrophihabitans telluris TaxID=2038343 RepID=A0ABY4QSD6_9ACTN|nr:hypothetical protein [Jatrophihabitans telluris]UQX86778.1 hypothetical protein M6D93_10710 [Jatrophihabitans telluris]
MTRTDVINRRRFARLRHGGSAYGAAGMTSGQQLVQLTPPGPTGPAPVTVEMLDSGSRFGILFVCTGNLHRSVMAERLLRSRLDDRLPVTVISTGIEAVVGAAVGEHSAVALRELGVDPEGHSARAYVPQLANNADLILTAERAHREQVLRDTPSALRRTFTLEEFARLAETVEPLPFAARPRLVELRAKVHAVAGRRGRVMPGRGPRDIADPATADLAETRRVAADVADKIAAVVRVLGLTPV